MGTGQEFAKKLGVVGCLLVLAMGVMFTVLLFTSRGGAVEGYEPPRDSAYYAAHPEELLEELQTNLLPKLDAGDVELSPDGDKLLVRAPKEALPSLRLTFTYYYDEELFLFEEAAGESKGL